MRIIARNRLIAYGDKHPDARASLEQWYTVARKATWKNMSDVMTAFSKAKTLNAERARFDVAGGEYRLVVAIDFRRSVVFIKFIGTHAEYDRIDPLTVSQF